MMEKINGNVVGIPNPITDWNQTDETKADFIKNKPDLNVFANALKGTTSGSAIGITDISPIEHNMGVKISGVDDLSTVKLYKQGKNLFNFDVDLIKKGYPEFGDATLVEKTETGVIAQGKVYASGAGTNSYYNGWFQPFLNKTTKGVYLKNGDTVTISADYTWLDISNYANSDINIHLSRQDGSGNNIGKHINKKPTEADIGKTFRVKVTHKNTKGDGYFIPIFTLNSCKVKIENIQISFDSDEKYEPYIEPTVYDVQADGTVEGVKSLYPNTTLYTDTSGAVIDCTYNRDINKAFAELQNAIIAIGGLE